MYLSPRGKEFLGMGKADAALSRSFERCSRCQCHYDPFLVYCRVKMTQRRVGRRDCVFFGGSVAFTSGAERLYSCAWVEMIHVWRWAVYQWADMALFFIVAWILQGSQGGTNNSVRFGC